MDHYAADARFVAPGWDLTGHHEIRRYYADSAERFPGLEVEVVSDFDDGVWAAVEWRAILVDADGMRYPIRGVNLASIEGGRLKEVRAHFDLSGLPLLLK
jgi:hypothetical protein